MSPRNSSPRDNTSQSGRQNTSPRRVTTENGRQYEVVASRLNRFRDKCPEHTIETEVLFRDNQRVLLQARILTPNGRCLATGHAMELRSSSEVNRVAAIENAETSSIGRALHNLGYLPSNECVEPVDLNGREYQRVSKRIQDLRNEYPEYSLVSEVLEFDSFFYVRAQVIDVLGRVLATGHSEKKASFNSLEKVETFAWGRALGAFLYAGEEFASADEVQAADAEREADSSGTTVTEDQQEAVAEQHNTQAREQEQRQEQDQQQGSQSPQQQQPAQQPPATPSDPVTEITEALVSNGFRDLTGAESVPSGVRDMFCLVEEEDGSLQIRAKTNRSRALLESFGFVAEGRGASRVYVLDQQLPAVVNQ